MTIGVVQVIVARAFSWRGRKVAGRERGGVSVGRCRTGRTPSTCEGGDER